MKDQYWKTLLLGTAISSFAAFPVYADDIEDIHTIDTEVAEIDEKSLSIGEKKVVVKIADDFTKVAGGEDNSRSLVSGLRTGGEITLDDLTYTSPTGPMGFGETFIAMALAEELVETSDQGLSLEDALGLDVDGASDQRYVDSPQVLVMRESGMGWGEIAKELGFNMGEVISAIRSSRPDRSGPTPKVERAAKAGRPEKADRIERVAKLNRPQKPERVSKFERLERPDRIERISRPDRPERPERIERISRPDRPERPERIERISRPERPDRPSRPGRG